MADQGNSFLVRFWGVRGSYPMSGRQILKFGGHTSCVEVRAGGHLLIFDAGTGIIALGKELLKKDSFSTQPPHLS
jgi:phosphoribosyl 1,2-cyclic phosphodiesterase